VPHAHPATFDRARRTRVKQQIRDRQLIVSNINAFTLFACGDTYHPTWIEDDTTLRQTRIDHTIGAVELAHDFECKTISLQPGGPLIGTRLSRQLAGERFAQGLEQVLPTARRLGIVLAIEPEPGLFIESSSEYLAFKRAFFPDEPLIRMNCDIGHLFCVGEDPSDVLRNRASEIAHVHVEDIGKNRVHQHLTPGKGVIDFASVFAAMDAIQYDGPATVELYPYETTAAGVAKQAWEHLNNYLDG
jgi:sugar phosphate isomerase/epimerase